LKYITCWSPLGWRLLNYDSKLPELSIECQATAEEKFIFVSIKAQMGVSHEPGSSPQLNHYIPTKRFYNRHSLKTCTRENFGTICQGKTSKSGQGKGKFSCIYIFSVITCIQNYLILNFKNKDIWWILKPLTHAFKFKF
jgi:hypothetical protein